MSSSRKNRFPFAIPLLLSALWAASCAAPLGPGYTIQRQEVAVVFFPGPQPRIEIRADFRLRNTGSRSLDQLDVRLPRSSAAVLKGISARWDDHSKDFTREADPEGDILTFPMERPWQVRDTHTLRLEYSIVQGEPATAQLDFSADGFYLPPEGWLAGPIPPSGLFGRGGAPPGHWQLSLRVPGDFLVHASGQGKRPRRRDQGEVLEFVQGQRNVSPYAVAGRYSQIEFEGSPCTVYLWTKSEVAKGDAERLAVSVQKIARVYETLFGSRNDKARAVWIVDRPIPSGVFGATGPGGSGDVTSFPLALPDVAFFPLSAEGGASFPQERAVAYIAEALAETWTGLGLNPGYEEQLEPLRTLPLYAAHVALEAEGAETRTETIRRALEAYDFLAANLPVEKQEGSKKELGIFTDGFAFPPKTLLFYFALEDRYGRDRLQKALRYMVQARRGRGYNLNALIGALDAETNQNAAEFVRLWRKHAGIPSEFRARYANGTAAAAASWEETKP